MSQNILNGVQKMRILELKTFSENVMYLRPTVIFSELGTPKTRIDE